MGFPGDNEREMSVENNSPVSAELPKSEQIFKKQRANGHGDAMTNNVGGGGGAGTKISGGGGDKATADVSSEDIDVTSMGENEPSANSRLAAGGAASGSGSGATPSPKKQDPLLKGRLKLIRIHVIGALFKHPKSQPFREPVDAKALGIFPLYCQIVKNPMDLGTVRKKIDRGAYRSREECVSDIEQVWTNAMTFNAPGHFVHEAAKLLRGIAQDKLSRLAKDEAAGKYKDVLDAAVMGAKPRPKPPAPRPSLASTLGGGGGDSDPDAPSREVRKRAVRKVSVDLPGEHTPPQHLKKKYVESLSGQMKRCDDILRELMKLKSLCEPFLRIPRAAYGNQPAADPIDLYKIQSKLQAGYYRHPLHFANDFRRMITETYRYSATTPMGERAAELQHQFELRFSRIDYEPVDDPSIYDDTSAAAEEESFLHQLSSATAQIAAIQENVTRLLKDSMLIRQAKRRASAGGRQGAPPTAATPRKRGRPKTASASSGGGGNEPKRQRVAAGKKGQAAAEMKGRGGNSASAASVSIDESIELRDLVSTLTEEQQQRIVQIMMENNETLTTDDKGFTEIDLGNCSAKTVQDVQSYIRQAKSTEVAAAAASAAKAAPAKKTPSPKKQQQQQRNGNLTDSSSADSSGDEGDSSSGSSSSSDDSDVDSLVD